MASNQQPDLNPTQAWQQVLSRDASASFVYAVASTGIFCRPSCPSRRPAPTNVRFFSDPAGALAAGYRACKRCAPLGERGEAATVAKLCRYLAAHRDRAVTLADLAKVARSSPFTVQRKFTRVLGLSPRAYQAQLRSTSMRRSLSTPGASITGAIYEAGYGSSSRFYEQAATDLGMSPTRFRERGLNETIRFATARCELGLLLVAATDRGVCSVMLGDEAAALEQLLRQQFSAAKVVADAPGMAEQMAAILCHHDRALCGRSTFRWMCVRPHFRRGYGRLCARFLAARRAAMRKWRERSVNRVRSGLWHGLAPPTR